MVPCEDAQVERHGQYCPVSFAADVLGDRWTLLIVRELIGGSTRFNEIERCLPRVSRSLLSQRLRHLERVGLVETFPLENGRGNSYHLTAAGKELEPVLFAMGEWAVRWIIGEPRPEELDPAFIMWWMHRRVNFDELPPGRTVVRFDILDKTRIVTWIVLESGESSICPTDPGFPPSVSVTAESLQLHRVFSGRITLAEALRDETIVLDGPRPLVQRFPRWFLWSPFYEVTQAHLSKGDVALGRPIEGAVSS